MRGRRLVQTGPGGANTQRTNGKSKKRRKARSASTVAVENLQWRVTQPSGKSHTHSADDGRTGWRLHAVKPDGSALCGLTPKHGWGVDLFESEMEPCGGCRKKLGTYCGPCKGTGRVYIETSPRHYTGQPCETCGGSGNPKDRWDRSTRREASPEELELVRHGRRNEAIAAMRNRTGCTYGEALDACSSDTAALTAAGKS